MAVRKLIEGLALLAVLPLAACASVPAGQDPGYEPKPAIWKISDADTSIYLFGTTHALPDGFRWRSARLDSVVEEADELIVETTAETMENKETGQALLRIIDPSAERPPLLTRVPEENRAALAAAIERAKLSLSMLDRSPTWLAAFGIALAQMKGEGYESANGVEDHLEAEFARAGKPIAGVEDPIAVFAQLNAMPEAAQRKLLVEAAIAEEEGDGAVGASDDAWATGDMDALAEEISEETMGKELYTLLIQKRNAAWTEWLVRRLEEPGTILFAVGAGHLAGPDSVQALLTAKGLTVERID